jgi:hypothetical protein
MTEEQKNLIVIRYEIEKRIELYETERREEGLSQIDKISLGARIAALQELLVFIKGLDKTN